MSDHPDDKPTGSVSNDRNVGATAVTSDFKVLGQLSADNGVGVLGQNDANSGTPIAVKGAVPNATNSGYGFSTPHDARILGVAELNALAGSLTGGNEVSNLAGDGIAIDGSGNLNWAKTYETNTFTASGTDWNAVSGLSSETPVEVTVDTTDQTSGRLRLVVDGSLDDVASTGDVLHRIVGPTSSVTIRSEEYFSQETSLDVSNDVSSDPWGIAFKGDGTKMFILTNNGTTVYSYSLSSSWEVDTATLNNTTVDVSSEDTSPSSLTFKGDGTKMFVLGSVNESVYSYILSTPWDLGSASYATSFDLSDQNVNFRGIAFKSDGAKMYALNNSTLYSYDLSTPWDLDTASYSNTSQYLADEAPRPWNVQFASNGEKMYVTRYDDSGQSPGPGVIEFSLSTPWDITSNTLLDTFDASNFVTRSSDAVVKEDESKLFLLNTGRAVEQFNTTFTGTVYASVEAD